MKLKIVILVTTLLALLYMLICTAVPFSPDKTKCMSDSACLTKTHWQQMGGFQICTPDGSRIGCWGTALAQLAYYYRFTPHGQVKYISSKGIKINQDLDQFTFNFALFSPRIDSLTSRTTIEQLATYNYYAALTVKKDFGTGKNMDLLPSPSLFEAHYNVKVARFISFFALLPYTNGKLEKVIYNELNNKRPVYLHFSNFNDIGHSVVVDAYCYDKGIFKVHLNQGQGGNTDGWYDFYKGFLKPDDNKLRVVYTFKPL